MQDIMNQEDINKYIHTEIMGKCWHESHRRTFEEREPEYGWFGSVKGFKFPTMDSTCTHCGVDIRPINSGGVDEVIDNYSFNYCADDKPRSLLNGVVAKVRELRLDEAFIRSLENIIPRYHDVGPEIYCQFLLCTATAKQIATACVEAHKATK